jgi:hypothetical protein
MVSNQIEEEKRARLNALGNVVDAHITGRDSRPPPDAREEKKQTVLKSFTVHRLLRRRRRGLARHGHQALRLVRRVGNLHRHDVAEGSERFGDVLGRVANFRSGVGEEQEARGGLGRAHAE